MGTEGKQRRAERASKMMWFQKQEQLKWQLLSVQAYAYTIITALYIPRPCFCGFSSELGMRRDVTDEGHFFFIKFDRVLQIQA